MGQWRELAKKGLTVAALDILDERLRLVLMLTLGAFDNWLSGVSVRKKAVESEDISLIYTYLPETMNNQASLVFCRTRRRS